jgi:hypothetical protein
MGSATINAKRDRVFGEKLVEQLSDLSDRGTWQPWSWVAGSGEKKIRAAHAKEKQRI